MGTGGDDVTTEDLDTVLGTEDTPEAPGSGPLRSSVEGDSVRVERSAVAIVRGEHVEVHQAGAGFVLADDDVSIDRGIARMAIAGEGLTITQGGAGMIVSGGQTTISQGGAGTLLVLGGATVQQGGSGVLIADDATITGGFVGIALARRLEVGADARVLIGGRQAGVLGALVAFLVVTMLLRRRIAG